MNEEVVESLGEKLVEACDKSGIKKFNAVLGAINENSGELSYGYVIAVEQVSAEEIEELEEEMVIDE